MKFGKDIHVPLRRNYKSFGDPSSFPSSSQNLTNKFFTKYLLSTNTRDIPINLSCILCLGLNILTLLTKIMSIENIMPNMSMWANIYI